MNLVVKPLIELFSSFHLILPNFFNVSINLILGRNQAVDFVKSSMKFAIESKSKVF